MLSPVQAFVLGAVQGLTELLPVSSSAHLYLVPTVLGWPYAGLAFDVALHAGTLVALLAAFWTDWWALARDAVSPDAVRARVARMTWLKFAAATVPALIAGKLLDDVAERLHFVPLQALMLFVFGAVLWACDRFLPAGRDEAVPGWPASLAIGASQALALVPGVSRSGITMSAGRAAGLSRIATARFSFMLAMPVTLAAVVYKAKDVPRDLPLPTLAIGVLSSAVFGIVAIRVLLGLVRRAGFGVFFAYRALLALALIAWFVSRG